MKKVFLFIVLTIGCLSLISCSDFLYGVAAGLMGATGYGGSPYSTYASPYGTTTAYPTTSSYSSASAYSSASTTSSTPRKCSRCNGTGHCKTCGGSGQVYDYGPASVISKDKYQHRCGVCDGTGKCGVCDGKGFLK